MRHPEQISVPTMIESVVETRPDKVALFFDDRPLTYAQLLQRSWAMANSLHELGLRPGDTVASLMDNCEEHAYLFMAASYAGLLEVAINTSFRGPFLSHQLRVARSRVILADTGLVPAILAVADELPDLECIVIRGGGCEVEPGRLRRMGTNDLLRGPNTRPAGHTPRWTDPCSVQFTSGTTGPSKGAVLSQNYMLTWARQFTRAWCGSENDVFLSTTPMFHMAAKGVGVLGALYRGASCAVDSRFSVSNFWNRVHHYDAVSTVLLGPMLTHVWNLPENERDRNNPLRNVIGSPIPPHLASASSACTA
jgi:crotonobetaine/carnitine-CoA ligase